MSTSEAEYIAVGHGVKEALVVRAVLSFVAPETSGPSIKVLKDNQEAKALIENLLSFARTSTCASTSSVVYSGHGNSLWSM